MGCLPRRMSSSVETTRRTTETEWSLPQRRQLESSTKESLQSLQKFTGFLPPATWHSSPAGHPCCRHRWRCRRPPLRHPPCHVHRLPHEEEGRGLLRTRRTQESSQCQLLFETSEQRVLRLNFL